MTNCHVMSIAMLAAALACGTLLMSVTDAAAQTNTRDHRKASQPPPGWGQSERPGRRHSAAGKPGGVMVINTPNSKR